MSRRQPDEERADAVLRIDKDGHVTVTLEGRPWAPTSAMSTGLPLGSTDVPWILAQLAAQRDAPLWVLVRNPGGAFKGIVVPKHLKQPNLSFSTRPPGRHQPGQRAAQPDRPPRSAPASGSAPGFGAP
jgi:hypothetical protein